MRIASGSKAMRKQDRNEQRICEVRNAGLAFLMPNLPERAGYDGLSRVGDVDYVQWRLPEDRGAVPDLLMSWLLRQK
jgi:hypothetical protein